MKYLLIGLILVHATLQIEIVPENSDLAPSGQDVPKKYFKTDSPEKGKHKKYREEDMKLKNKENSEGKYYKDSEKWKHEKSKKYEEKSKKYQVVSQHEEDRSLSMAKDTDVNYNDFKKHIEPDSELLRMPKVDFYKEMKKIDLTSPPSPNDTIRMARYIVHNVDWAALATVTTRSGSKHSPFANIVSMSDGPVEQGSGVPFFYMTPMDLSTQDLVKENKASITVTLAQTPYCLSQNLDPEDPRCARLILSGKIKRVKVGTPEEEFGKKALFTRHPVMESWPKDHDFYISKFKIGQIVLLDQFGGPKYLSVEDYLHIDDPSQ